MQRERRLNVRKILTEKTLQDGALVEAKKEVRLFSGRIINKGDFVRLHEPLPDTWKGTDLQSFEAFAILPILNKFYAPITPYELIPLFMYKDRDKIKKWTVYVESNGEFFPQKFRFLNEEKQEGSFYHIKDSLENLLHDICSFGCIEKVESKVI